MLGARARAAEYNAAKAASARQASREAEEQKLPPKPVPVSLSAFTRNAQPNRNKGTKAYVPLVLNETPGEEDDEDKEDKIEKEDKDGKGDSNDDGTLSTPARQARAADRTIPAPPKSGTPLGPRNPQPVRDIATPLSVPTAPKAMVSAAEKPTALAVPTPHRGQPHPVLRQPRQAVPPSVQSSPSTVSGMGGFPYPDFMKPYLPALPPLGYLPVAYPQPPQYLGNMMVPSDISPAKQENKLTMLSHRYGDPSMKFGGTPQQGLLSPGVHTRSQIINPYTTATPGRNPQQQFGGLAHNPAQHSIFHNFDSEEFVPINTEERRSLPMPPASLPRRLSYGATDDSFPLPGPIVDSPGKGAPERAQHGPAGTPEDEPYDRNSKMQNFVAAQQALAKTGKTVLHNPDLHRVKGSEPQRLLSTENDTTTPEHESHIPVKEDNTGGGTLSWLKPPPGFENHTPRLPTNEEYKLYNPSPFGDEALRKEFGVGTEDWFELKPMSRIDRLRMNKVMKLCSSSIYVDSPKALFPDGQNQRRDHILGLLEGGHSHCSKRDVVEQIANDHVANRLANNPGSDEAVGNARVDVEMEKAHFCAVGNIRDNLTKSTAMDEPFPNKYKPAPEYAIERGGLLVGQPGSSSFFEEDTGGFYNAPSRIARDPRFRPVNKEGNKPQSEDEWKHRSDLYGRRRL